MSGKGLQISPNLVQGRGGHSPSVWQRVFIMYCMLRPCKKNATKGGIISIVNFMHIVMICFIYFQWNSRGHVWPFTHRRDTGKTIINLLLKKQKVIFAKKKICTVFIVQLYFFRSVMVCAYCHAASTTSFTA